MGSGSSTPAAAANQRRSNQGVTNANGLGPTPAPRTPAGYFGTEPAEQPTMRTPAPGMGPARRQNAPAGAAAAPLGQNTPAGAAGLRGGKRRRNQRKTKRNKNKSKSKKSKKSNKN